MQRLTLPLTVFIILLATSSACSKSRPAVISFDAAEGFSATANPSGPWSYGAIASGAENRFEAYKAPLKYGAVTGWTKQDADNDGSILFNPTEQKVVVGTYALAAKELTMHPGRGGGHTLAVLRWTAPEDGTATVDAAVTSIGGNPATTLAIVAGGKTLATASTISNQPRTAHANHPVKQGEPVDFRLDFAGDFISLTTAVKAKVVWKRGS